MGNIRPNNTIAKDSQKSEILIIANYKFNLAYYSPNDVKQLLVIKKKLYEPRARRIRYGVKAISKVLKHAAIVKLKRIALNNSEKGFIVLRSDISRVGVSQSVRGYKVYATNPLRDESQNSFEVRERREEPLAKKPKSEKKPDPWADWDEQFAETIHRFKNPNVDPHKWGKEEEKILKNVEDMSKVSPRLSKKEISEIIVNGMLYID